MGASDFCWGLISMLAREMDVFLPVNLACELRWLTSPTPERDGGGARNIELIKYASAQ